MKKIIIIALLMIAVSLYSEILNDYKEIKGTPLEKKLLDLSRRAIKIYLEDKKVVEPDFILKDLWPGIATGIFITLVKDNKVRGCIGSFYPRKEGLLKEIIYTSIEATYKDYRFKPVYHSELDDIKIIITIVGKREIVEDPYSVNLMKYGLLITRDRRSAALLPGEARTADWGIKQILKLSGIYSLHNAECIKFKTITFDERRSGHEKNY